MQSQPAEAASYVTTPQGGVVAAQGTQREAAFRSKIRNMLTGKQDKHGKDRAVGMRVGNGGALGEAVEDSVLPFAVLAPQHVS